MVERIVAEIEVKIQSENFREYYLNRTISSFTRGFYPDLDLKDEVWLKKLGGAASTAAREIVNLPGIKLLWIHHSKIGLERRPPARWKDLEPEVIESLKKVFGGEEKEVRVIYPNSLKTLFLKLLGRYGE